MQWGRGVRRRYRIRTLSGVNRPSWVTLVIQAPPSHPPTTSSDGLAVARENWELKAFVGASWRGKSTLIQNWFGGCQGGSVVERLPSTQDVIPGSWDRVPHRVPFRVPASPPACVFASLSVSLMNK